MSDAAQRKGRLPGWGVGLIGAGLLLVIGLVVVIILGHAATARWERYAAKLRAGGDPLTFEEIEGRRATVPEELNGARVLEQLYSELNNLPTNTREYEHVLGIGRRGTTADFFAGVPRYTIEPSKRFLDAHRDCLDRLYAIENTPMGRFQIEHAENPIATLLPPLGTVRKATKLLWLDGTLKLIEGDPQAAARRVSIIFHISRTLHDDPFVISRLVMIAVDRLAVRGLESTFRTGELDEPTLTRLSDQLDRQLAASTMRWGCLGERASFVGVCDQVATGKVSLAALAQMGIGGTGPLGGTSWLPEFLIRKNQMEGARLLTLLVEAGDDPRALLDASRQMAAEMRALPATQVLVRMLLPSLTRAMELHVMSIARLRCARVAVAAERFRLDTGRLPDSIEELAPRFIAAPPTDPFDGKALRFVIVEEGIVIYSIGEDLEDDDGSVAPVEGEKRPRDLGFRLFKPDRRGVLLTDEPPSSDD